MGLLGLGVDLGVLELAQMSGHVRLLALLVPLVATRAAELAPSVTSSLEGRLTTELPLDSVRVVLNGGAYSAIPRQDGSFKLHAVRANCCSLDEKLARPEA